MKKLISFFLIAVIIISAAITSSADSFKDDVPSLEAGASLNTDILDLDVKGACLIEAQSGTVLYTQNELYSASVASVTKVMTLLLVAEALRDGCFKLDDTVTISPYAASMGGSQVFLEEGESMTVEELIKCTVIASANDAAVALAELCAGSEAAFVKLMNAKAKSLALKSTSFENATGLDDTTTEQYSCPFDIAVMSRELIKHDIILKYSSVWQDTIRNGEFTLTNTNRLVRYYRGCNGLKTGSTDKAGFCVSTTAMRDGMQLIAVITGAETKDKRNEAARALLDFGFANYTYAAFPSSFIEDVPVIGGQVMQAPVYSTDFCTVVERSKSSQINAVYEIPENLIAPLKAGDAIGKIRYELNGNILGEVAIIVKDDVDKISILQIFLKIIKNICSGC